MVGTSRWVRTSRTGEALCMRFDTFSGSSPLTPAHSRYLNQSDAMAQGLTYVNANGNVIIRVDNTTNGTSPIYRRNSVCMMTQDTIEVGSLVLFQARHMPYGCGVCMSITSPSSDSSGAHSRHYVRARVLDFGKYRIHLCSRPLNPPLFCSGR